MNILRVSNGYLIRDEDEGLDLVIEEDSIHPNPAADAARRMLWEVNEAIGHAGGRYDEYRVHIELRPGDKWGDAVE